MKRTLCVLLALVLALGVFTVGASASDDPGWYWEGDGYRYYTDDGSMQTGWFWWYGSWYYLDTATGIMQTGWQNVGGTWYYLNDSGAMVTGWQKIGDGWYYFGTGAKQTGWVYTGGAWYYLDPAQNGKMLANGTYYISGYGWCIFNANGVWTGYGQAPDEPDDPDESDDPDEPEDWSNVQVGDIITFGSYEQDNDTTNGTEDIKWIVLAVDGSSVFVVSRYALDCQLYNTSFTSVTWETCTLRTWLNGTFYNTAFTAAEQAQILTTTVVNDDNPSYGTEGGNNTQDKVFLLSIDEVEQYFADDADKKCLPTDYAVAQGAYKWYALGTMWWLRTPGYTDQFVAYGDIGSNGIYDRGMPVNTGESVRPAMWINLAS